MRALALSIAAMFLVSACVTTQAPDRFSYKGITVKWLGHAGFEILGSKKIYVDPYNVSAGAADFILLTHSHYDHCDKPTIQRLQGNATEIIGAVDCIKTLSGHTYSLRPGEAITYPYGLKIEAVQAYNVNSAYHPKGTGIGFLITMDNVTIYHAGDTDLIPEMSSLRGIDVALLPIGGSTTMDAGQAAEAANAINPKVAIPMHYNSEALGISGFDADPKKLAELLEGTGIEIKILAMSR